MIGAGALGCELLKNWALMGVATADDGRVVVTDMDQIERSNLNRQFLFRNDDIGKMKSVAAAASVVTMNPAIRIEAHTNRLCLETLGVYNDTFYQSLDGVCNALDNIEARVFSDERCVFYGLPLLESGTLGPKGNFQAFMPHLMQNYGARPPPPGAGIPMCTLHHFPSNIEHTTMWARDIFVGLFDQAPRATSMVLEDPDYISKNRAADAKALVDTVKEMLVTHSRTA
jgi:ubiquitin-activating enzyme E1